MSFLLSDARQFLQDYDRSNGSSRAQRVYDKIANDSLREMYSLGEFDFSTRTTRLSFTAPYSTGTVSISGGGTAVTGSGTTFTAAMVGRFIRFNNEAEQYRITAYTNATSITVEAYLGTDNLSAVTFVITDERKALPSNFRSLQSIHAHQQTSPVRSQLWELEPLSFAKLNAMRLYYQTTTLPRYYSIKWENPASGNIPLGYIHIYPTPSVAQIANVYYNIWPVTLTTSTDEFPIPYEAEGVVREFLLGGLYREEGKEWLPQMERARAEAFNALNVTRGIDQPQTRAEWMPPSMKMQNRVPVIDASVLAQMDP